MKNSSFRKNGFTLIELLVVISIIGMLSSVILSSLNNARKKGNDGKVKSQLIQLRNAAALYYSVNNNYSGTPPTAGSASCSSLSATNGCSAQCSGTLFTDQSTGMSRLATYASYPTGTILYCATNGTSQYAVAATLSNTSLAWCVDATGASNQISFTSVPISIIKFVSPTCITLDSDINY